MAGADGGGRGRDQGRTSSEETADRRAWEVEGEAEGQSRVQVSAKENGCVAVSFCEICTCEISRYTYGIASKNGSYYFHSIWGTQLCKVP